MRMIAIHAQTERKRLDRSVRCAEKRRRQASTLRIHGPIRPVTAACATPDAARGEKRLSRGRIQAIFTSVGTPLGECRLRAETVSIPRILVVLFLPKNDTEWLKHSEDALSLQKCAYWVSLRGAAPSENKTAQQVYLPVAQKFDVDGLKEIFRRISKNEHLIYEGAVE